MLEVIQAADRRLPTTPFQAGDDITIECSYGNLTAIPAPSGAAATDEMCLIGMYRYPAQGAGAFDCVK